jgi:hypothetical protein
MLPAIETTANEQEKNSPLATAAKKKDLAMNLSRNEVEAVEVTNEYVLVSCLHFTTFTLRCVRILLYGRLTCILSPRTFAELCFCILRTLHISTIHFCTDSKESVHANRLRRDDG